ncbi:MAG: hypothetical protein PVI09_13905 [Anaerolineae bacterium]|jgi:hypothetical protein
MKAAKLYPVAMATLIASLAQMLAFNEQARPMANALFGLVLIDFGDGYWGHPRARR